MVFLHLIDRLTAKNAGLKYYFNGRLCKNGNTWQRRVSTRNCVCSDCIKQKNYLNSKHYQKIKDTPEFKAKIRQITKANRENKKLYDRQYRSRTREKQREFSRNWVANNPDKRRSIAHNYKAKRRVQVSNGVTTKQLFAWIENQEKTCYWCGQDCSDAYHVDHYVPLSKGGPHELHNLVIACPSCNLRKSARDPYEFAAEHGRLF